MADQTLLLTAEKALTIKADIEALEALAATAARWAELAPNVPSLASAEALVDAIAAGLEPAGTAKAFADLGLEREYVALTRFLGRVKDGFGKIPKEIKLLLNPLSSFANGQDASVDWKIGVDDQPVVKTDRYALNLGAHASLGFDALAKWPGEGTAPPRLLKIAAEGEVTAGAKATIPFAPLSIAGEGSATARTALAYYFDVTASQGQLYAAAVAGRFARLADPFDFQSVWDAFQGSDLCGVDYGFGGVAAASVEITFADALALSGGLTADVGFKVGVSASIKGDYGLRLQKVGASGRQVGARLTRGRVDEAAFNASLGLTVDLSKLTEPVLAALKTAASQWDDAIKAITPFLSPGTWLRDKALSELQAGAGKLVADAGLREAIITDLKGALGVADVGDEAVSRWLSDQLAGVLNRASALIEDPANAAIDRAVAAASQALPIVSLADQGGKLKALLKSLIDTAEKDLEDAVTGLLAKPADEVIHALAAAGVQVNGAVNTLNKMLAPVRDLLTRADAVFHKILTAAEDAAKSKASARLYVQEKRTSKLTVEVAGVFSADGGPSEEVFKALTRGNLQSLVELIEHPKQAPGFELVKEASFLTRYSGLESEDGVEISFLNIALKFSELISGDAEVKVDGSGNVHVHTTGEFSRMFSISTDVRKVSFVDDFAIALAAATKQLDRPTLDVSIGASYADNSMHWANIQEFMSSLADARLISAEALPAARTAFDRWAGSAGQISAEIAAGLRLQGAATEAFMQLSSRQNGVLSDLAKQAIVTAGIDALIDRKVLRFNQFKQGAANAAGVFNHPPPPTILSQIVLKHMTELTEDVQRPHNNIRPDVDMIPFPQYMDEDAEADYAYFLRQARGLYELAHLIDAMGAIYEATPSPDDSGEGGTWTAGKYRAQQEAMLEATRFWLIVADSWKSLFGTEVSHRTAAFLRVAATLAGVPKGAPCVKVTLTYRPTGKKSEAVSFE
jgi:hypothetical protein